MRKVFYTSLAAMVWAGGLLGPRPAAAEPTNVLFCNHYRRAIFVALAYQSGSGWNSVGWWPVSSGHCSPFTVPYKRFWFRAETEWADLGDGRRVREEWGGAKKLYIAYNGGFRYSQADRQHENSRLAGFDESVTWTGDGYIRERVTISSDGRNTIQTVGPNVLQDG